MTTAISKPTSGNQAPALPEEMVTQLILHGDLKGLTKVQQVEYVKNLCQRLGLDPATQPIKLLSLQGKVVPYFDRNAAQQFNRRYKISHERKHTETIEGVYVVYFKATDGDGRCTESAGAVNISGLKGDNLANALMKAETKAKRRATMDLIGLGMLDETEIETIPHAELLPEPIIKEPVNSDPPVVTEKETPVSDPTPATPDQNNVTDKLMREIAQAKGVDDLKTVYNHAVLARDNARITDDQFYVVRDGLTNRKEGLKNAPKEAVTEDVPMPESTLTQAQLKKIFAIAKKTDMSKERLDELVKHRYRIDSIRFLTPEQYDEFTGSGKCEAKIALIQLIGEQSLILEQLKKWPDPLPLPF